MTGGRGHRSLDEHQERPDTIGPGNLHAARCFDDAAGTTATAMGQKREKRRKRSRLRRARLLRPGRGLPMARDTVEELRRRRARTWLVEFDDGVVGLSVHGKMISFAELKTRWAASEGEPCPRCGEACAVILSSPSVRTTACLGCGLSFAIGGPSHGEQITLARAQPHVPPPPQPRPGPWSTREPRWTGCPGSAQGRAYWMTQARGTIAAAWRLREVDGVDDHVRASMFETNISALRAPGLAGPSIALLKCAWRAEPEPPQCTRCRLPWLPLLEEEPPGVPFALATFAMVEDDVADAEPVLVAHRICLGCMRSSAGNSPFSLNELMTWASRVRSRR